MQSTDNRAADRELLSAIVTLLDDKKAEDIVVYDVNGLSSITDYLVIATGNSDTHITALSGYLMEEMKKHNAIPYAREGVKVSRWVCIDYSGIMVHIMGKAERDYYDLESIWGGAEEIDLGELVAGNR